MLQHPSEVNQTKGTVSLLKRSLKACQVLVGEDFTENTELNEILAQHQALLLYPSERSDVLTLITNTIENSTVVRSEDKPKLLIILDGTWRKAYRMFKLSTNIQALKQVCLPEYLANNGQYLIRKVAKKNALSSLEATCFALAMLDGELLNYKYDNQKKIDCGRYQTLLNKFAQFNQFQLSFRK